MRRIAVPTAVAALALVAGCGSSDGPAAAPTTPTPSAASTASDTPTDVASGIRLTTQDATVAAPEGWTRGKAIVSGESVANGPHTWSFMTLSRIEAFSTMGAEELGRTRIRSSLYKTPPKLLPVTELDGVAVYHVAGFVSSDRYIEEYGAIRNGWIVQLSFSFNEKVGAAERKAVVEQVLPTFSWR